MERNRNIDEQLESAAQRAVSDAVKLLPEETLSMSWRSTLNERLLQASEKRRKRERFLLFFRPTAGLATAFALAMLVFVHPANRDTNPVGVQATSPNVEAAIVSMHREAATGVDVAGTGLTAVEAANYATSQPVLQPSWDELDVESL